MQSSGNYSRTTVGPVAQSAEQLTHNQLVAGSSPAGPIVFSKDD